MLYVELGDILGDGGIERRLRGGDERREVPSLAVNENGREKSSWNLESEKGSVWEDVELF
jgi:hypothetical protein